MTTEAVYVLEKMAHGFGRMGRDAGRGFYDYDDGEAPELWSGLRVFERRRAAVSHDDLRDRLMFIQAIESMRCLDEGVVACAADANLSAVLGWGFPASHGGAIAFIDSIGVRAFAERARDLATRFGERFEPPSLLLRHAERDEPFGGAAK
jgi:3-hydroxyacyl-CoA dehydrogenase/enoyl-CoA hydratase/3-hydroxybutyryl-CoA epimerase